MLAEAKSEDFDDVPLGAGMALYSKPAEYWWPRMGGECVTGKNP